MDSPNKKLKFKFISTSHPYYHDELMLRWEVLRKPLGMPPGSEISPEEKSSLHLVALDKKKVVGCILFHQESSDSGIIYEVALSDEYNGEGFARKLFSALELELVNKGIKHSYLYANEDAQGFYERMGYLSEGEIEIRQGQPQKLMKKTISAHKLAS